MSGTKATIDLIGRLARDAELKYTTGGSAALHFTLVTADSRKKDDKWEEYPSFWDITLWGKAGEKLVNYMTNGRLISCLGKARIDQWTHNDQPHLKVKVDAVQVTLLPSGGGRQPAGAEPQGMPDGVSGDPPF